jgi:hypothetical protein
MSAGPPSLEAAVRTCKVDTAYANKVQSDRFLNPSNVVCPIWRGVDLTGREVCNNSFYTKTAGCNSSNDRICIENDLRPKYSEYVTLDAAGWEANLYNNGSALRSQNMYSDNMAKDVKKVVGSFGNQYAEVYPSCGYYPYQRAMENKNMNFRENYASCNLKSANGYRTKSGM